MASKDRQILAKINHEIKLIGFFIRGMNFISFNSSEITKRAVCMTLIIIGELVKSLSDEIKDDNKQIAWEFVSDFSNIAERYYLFSKEVIEIWWEIINTDLLTFQKQVTELLNAQPGGDN